MGEPPTQAIPPVPPTPPEGTRITREELHSRYCPDCPDREACNQGAQCWQVRFFQTRPPERFEPPPNKSWVETEQGKREDSSAVWVGLLVVAAVAVALVFATLGVNRALSNATDRQRAWSTRTEMDWTIARMTDRDLSEVCRGTRTEWRTDTIDRFFIGLNKNFADGPVPDRNEITAYLDRMCRANGWGRVP